MPSCCTISKIDIGTGLKYRHVVVGLVGCFRKRIAPATTVSQSNVGWCSFTSVFQLDNFCLRGAFNKQKFMSRKISCASNGSFNPHWAQANLCLHFLRH